MTVLQYPGFVEGQILRRDDLNGLRDYLADRDRTLAQVVGVGIAGGLVGEVTVDGLRITAGLAIDQRGEALMLAADQILPLPPTADDVKVPFDFLDPAVQGFTVVLVRTEVPEKRVPCTETGCSGHSVVHDIEVEPLVVPGRLVPYRTDFSLEPLLSAVPLSRTPTGGVSGSFVTLRDQVLARVGTLLATATRQRLATMTIATTDRNAVALAKAAFLNQVLFAALDLLRFKALMDRDVFLETQTPGVALGWLRPAGGGWAWDCAYRHAWDPQVGVGLALFGGTCGDPSLPWVQRLASIIDTFEPPVIPDDTQPPIIVDPPFICRLHHKFIHDDCNLHVYPPVEIDPNWFDKWKDIPDWGDLPFKVPQPVQPDDVYYTDPAPVDFGLIDLVSVLGSNAQTTQGLLVDVIEKSGVTKAGVDILTANQAKPDGFTFDGAAGPGDRVVLIENDAHRVIGTGRVPLTQTVRDLGVQLPEAVGKANVAAAQATEAIGKYNALNGKVETFGTTFVTKDVFAKAELERSDFQTNITKQLTGLNVTLKDEVAVQVATFKAEIATQLPMVVSDSFGSIQEQLQKVNGRVDTLFTRPKVGGIQDVAVSDNLTAVLRGLRTTVAETAPPDKQAEVETHLKEVDLNLARIDALTTAGGSALGDSPEALTGVVDSLVAGLKAAGAPASSVRAVTKQATALRKTLNG